MELKQFTPSNLAFIYDTLRDRLPFREWHVVARSAIHEVMLLPENPIIYFKGANVTMRIYPLVIYYKWKQVFQTYWYSVVSVVCRSVRVEIGMSGSGFRAGYS